MKILIVDDSSLARRLTRHILEELGHSVEDASDGEQALERYVINRHDVVLLDMVMKGMYGLEVLGKFRELNPQLPVIIATADIQKATRNEVQAAGAAGILNKPLKREEVCEVLATILSGGSTWN